MFQGFENSVIVLNSHTLTLTLTLSLESMNPFLLLRFGFEDLFIRLRVSSFDVVVQSIVHFVDRSPSIRTNKTQKTKREHRHKTKRSATTFESLSFQDQPKIIHFGMDNKSLLCPTLISFLNKSTEKLQSHSTSEESIQDLPSNHFDILFSAERHEKSNKSKSERNSKTPLCIFTLNFIEEWFHQRHGSRQCWIITNIVFEQRIPIDNDSQHSIDLQLE